MTRTSTSTITFTMSPCPSRDKRALLDLLSDIASTPLDYRRPLGRFTSSIALTAAAP